MLTPYFSYLASRKVNVKVILFLEGKFTNEPVVFRVMADEMKKRLRWRITKVLIDNLVRPKENVYNVQRLHQT